MEKEQRDYKAHCLVFPYPSQGHINPLLQFSKLLDHKGVKVTLVTTRFIYNTMYKGSCCTALETISLEAISDGFDEGWKTQGVSIQAYLESLWKVGSQNLAELIEKLSGSGCPVDCLVYDAFMPWPLDIAKKFGIVGAVFFTQSCAVDNIYNHVNKGVLKLPLTDSEISLPGMPPLEPLDLPSFLSDFGSYPAFFEVVIGQFCNIDKADWVLCNTFYELEEQVSTLETATHTYTQVYNHGLLHLSQLLIYSSWCFEVLIFLSWFLYDLSSKTSCYITTKLNLLMSIILLSCFCSL